MRPPSTRPRKNPLPVRCNSTTRGRLHSSPSSPGKSVRVHGLWFLPYVPPCSPPPRYCSQCPRSSVSPFLFPMLLLIRGTSRQFVDLWLCMENGGGGTGGDRLVEPDVLSKDLAVYIEAQQCDDWQRLVAGREYRDSIIGPRPHASINKAVPPPWSYNADVGGRRGALRHPAKSVTDKQPCGSTQKRSLGARGVFPRKKAATSPTTLPQVYHTLVPENRVVSEALQQVRGPAIMSC
jgi:hypothetical protein